MRRKKEEEEDVKEEKNLANKSRRGYPTFIYYKGKVMYKVEPYIAVR